jgi:hypothetical protein
MEKGKMIRRYKTTINVLKEELKINLNRLQNLQSEKYKKKRDLKKYKDVVKSVKKRIKNIEELIKYLDR